MSPSPRNEPCYLVLPVHRAVVTAGGLTVRRVCIVHDGPDPNVRRVAFEGFALIDEARQLLHRLFVVRPHDHCLLEWPLVPAMEDNGAGPPVFESARRLRASHEEDPS